MELKWKILTLLFTIATTNYGQLSSNYNRICIGDSLVKQQIEYKNPGEPGKNIIWDFSQTQTIRDEYPIVYTSPTLIGDSIYIIGNDTIPKQQGQNTEYIIGKEYGTIYYYKFKNDTLSLTGHENPIVRLTYPEPLMANVFPLNYNDEYSSQYISKGIYSNSLKISSSGNIKIKADAYGKIILPTGDTISPVLRVKTTQIVHKSDKSFTLNDSIQPEYGNNVIETYKWYAKGYRYPVFETIHNILNDTLLFGTSFFLPPQEQQTGIEDSLNRDLINLLWDIEKKNPSQNRESNTYNKSNIENKLKINCTVYPNPVKSDLIVKYTIKKPSNINISLYSSDGKLAFKTEKELSSSGTYSENIDFRDFPQDSYLLLITEDKEIKFTEKIIKK